MYGIERLQEKISVICYDDSGVRKYTPFYAPKAIVVVSNCPQFAMHKQLIDIFHTLRTTSYPKISVCLSTDRKLMQSSKLNRSKIQKSIIFAKDPYLPFIATPQKLWEFYLSAALYYSQSSHNRDVVHFTPYNHIQSITFSPTLSNLYQIHSQHYQFQLFLSYQNTYKVLSSILHQKQIILISSNINKCVSFAQTVLTMLRPFKWQFMYAPHLPSKLFDALDSFMPYIVGVHSQHKSFIYRHYSGKDKIIVSLDEDQVFIQDNTFMLLPRRVGHWLKGCYSPQNISIIKRQIRMKKCGIRIVMAILGDFIKSFVRTDSRVMFVESQYLKTIPRQDFPFFKYMVSSTMLFQNLIQQVESLLTDSKAAQGAVTRQFLKLAIMQRNRLDQTSSKQIEDYIEKKFHSVQKRQSITLDSLKYFGLFCSECKLKQAKIVNIYNCKATTQVNLSLRQNLSDTKLTLSTRLSLDQSIRLSTIGPIKKVHRMSMIPL